MLARVRKSMEEKDQGFTLIELLVVMIIIGILAAIAIPVFLNQRKKAQDSAAKADVSTIGKEIATWYVDNTAAPVLTSTGTATAAGQYKIGADVIGNTSTGVVLPAANQFFASPSSWCVTVKNAAGNKAVVGYKYSAAGGLAEGACATAAG